MRKTFGLFLFICFFACNRNPFAQSRYQPEPYNVSSVVVPKQDVSPVSLPEKPAIYAVLSTTQGNLVLELFDKDAPKTVQNFIDLAQGEKEFLARNGQKVKKPFYDGLTFHRVIENFMIQGGCPNGDGTGGPGYRFEDEINAKSLGLDKIQAGQAPYYQYQLQRAVANELQIKTREEAEAKREQIEKAFEDAKKLSVLEILYRTGYKYNETVTSHRALKGSLAMANAGPNTNGSQFFINQVDTPHLDGLHTVFGQLISGSEVVDRIVRAGNSKTTIKKVFIVDKRNVPASEPAAPQTP
ncbi:peptidylprolyl isomerase [Leptospira gomenensis]|uniref:Peptidyl-prolyl cis-trans isomerase n=1 Tax=Leptospira gomenensis TaxID=2484974 RepID=A0A5F1YCC9_9LEPT|nr:peptidylprolyl isomerase [Leptospira gomenensis]TGK35449.1 peptidylprolyl isomerase [Leptospira gomenensis]TGK40659.1 peptidylprolyl isomerase [Leptospira gomenensis]TGK46337.1 peptidylprolyl isomerase [Leptospira gomenensis]TGK66472.1 peptidylprolyl isomerase [Leptospira gomenensis]